MNRFLEFSARRPFDWTPAYTSDVVSWQPHIPFAFALMKLHRPSSLVELGTHKGDSYLAFCEAARRYSTGTVCRAIDTWRGDPQARHYGDEVLNELRARHDLDFGDFSTLTQSTFDDALLLVPDGSVDLLHIDGLHTYEAVRHDFESWLPKLSPRGIVLFHDTEVRRDDFGVHRLWAELSERFGGFSFLHGFGLGVLPVGPEAAVSLPDLFQAGEKTRDEIRALYRSLGYSIAYENLLDAIHAERMHHSRETDRLLGELAGLKESFASSQAESVALGQLLSEVDRSQNKDLHAAFVQCLAKEQVLLNAAEEKLRIAEDFRRKVENSGFYRLFAHLRSVVAALIDVGTGWFASLAILVCGRGWNFFDADFYLREYPKKRRVWRRPLVDYALSGFRAGRKPNESNLLPPVLQRLDKTKHPPRMANGSVLPPPQEVSNELGLYESLTDCLKAAARGWLPEPIRRSLLQLRRPAAPPALPVYVPPVRDLRPLVFPEVSAPSVSIVVAVHGQRDCVYRCLRSLRVHRSKYSFEVIVVDDVSPDDTPAMLSGVSGIKLITNESNLGFIRSCNKGASIARGDLLVMLNSDTVVQPGWLDELVDTFKAFPEAGLVGSKLIYPDGTLQEAGGLIWSDGSGWNVGRNGDASAPEHNYLREVDYCSGASIMVPRDLWNSLGGFDEAYVPAYAEDSDLAFRIRAAGRRVFYQPLSLVIHYEGMSCGRDTGSGVKAYQVRNALKLRERWQEQMLCLGNPGKEPHKTKDRNVTGRLLVLDHCNPTPDQDAGSITSFNIMRIFRSLGWKVTFIPEDNFVRADPETPAMQRIGIECLYHPYVNSVRRHLEQYGSDYDAVLVFRSSCLQRHLGTIRETAPQAKIIYHTSDLHYLREQREAELSGSEEMGKSAARTRNTELALVEAADATVVHSSEEQQLLGQETGCPGKIFLFPWAIDIPGTESSWEVRDGLVFVGGFQHTPNVDAVLHFADNIWPLVRRKMPDAVFRVVGSRVPAQIRDLHGNGIEVLGFVSDLTSLMDRSRLMVAPLRFGAGIKGKIGTALSHGLPVVTTSIGAEGMDLLPGEGVRVADDPEAFADLVADLYGNPDVWERESRGAVEFARRRYSLAAGCEVVSEILRRVGLGDRSEEPRPVVLSEQLSPDFHRCYPPDHRHDPLEEMVYSSSRAGLSQELFPADRSVLQRQREMNLLSYRTTKGHLIHQGFCRVCNQEAEFAIVAETGETPADWDRQLVCENCGLNNRERALAHAAAQHIRHHIRDRVVELCVDAGDESGFRRYGCLSGKASPGGGAGRLTFFSGQGDAVRAGIFDLFLVCEFPGNPADAERLVSEARRILRPGGLVLLAATPETGGEAPGLNGLLSHLEKAGFQSVQGCFYWSDVYGHLGANQLYVTTRVP
jgi:GT2 family glycosyltransferase/glycosyltransferase involved in cell wall biosynthesis